MQDKDKDRFPFEAVAKIQNNNDRQYFIQGALGTRMDVAAPQE